MFQSHFTAKPTQRHFNNTESHLKEVEERLLILAVIEYALFDYRRAFYIPSITNIQYSKAAYSWLNAPYNPRSEASLGFWCAVVFEDPEAAYARIRKMASKYPPAYDPEAYREALKKHTPSEKQKAKAYTRGSSKKVGRPTKAAQHIYEALEKTSTRGGEHARSFVTQHRQIASPRAVIKNRPKKVIKKVVNF